MYTVVLLLVRVFFFVQEEIAFDSAFSKLRMTGTGAQDPAPEVAR